MTIEQFWRLSWREFILYRRGYEARQLREWERARMISYMVYVNVTKYEKNRQKIEKFLPLQSDEQEDLGTPLSREQFIEAQKKWKLIHGKRDTQNNTNGG